MKTHRLYFAKREDIIHQAPFTVPYVCTGEGYKGYRVNNHVGDCEVSIVRNPNDGSLILWFGGFWAYSLSIINRLRADDKEGLCVDFGAGYVIPNQHMQRVVAWVTEVMQD